jgi:hypothetical protein
MKTGAGGGTEDIRHGRKRMLLASIGLLALTLFAVFAGSAKAQNWNGATSNDWTDATNWVEGTVPTGAVGVGINTSSPNPRYSALAVRRSA